MPLINVKVIEGVFSAEQKTQIIRKLTDAMVEIEGEAMRQVTWTVIEEVKSGEWGIAGKPLSRPTSEHWPPLAPRGRLNMEPRLQRRVQRYGWTWRLPRTIFSGKLNWPRRRLSLWPALG